MDHSNVVNLSVSSGWAYLGFSIICIVAAGLGLGAFSYWNATSRAATAPTPPALIKEPEYRTVTPAPSSDQPELNRDFSENPPGWAYRSLMTAAGYPIIGSIRPAPVCSDPFTLKEAMDAWKANDQRWLRKIPGCITLPEGTEAEWTKKEFGLGTGAMEFRVALPDGRRLKLYGPDGIGDPWFGVADRNQK